MWVAVISAGAALTGVLLADIRQRGREYKTSLAMLRRDAFVDVYAWSLAAHDALRKVTTNHVRQKSEDDRTELEIPALSPQVLARLRNYLDPEIAGYAKRASQELSKAQRFP